MLYPLYKNKQVNKKQIIKTITFQPTADNSCLSRHFFSSPETDPQQETASI